MAQATIRPNWTEVWEDNFIRIRDQLRAERAAGMRPRLGMKSYSDDQIERYTRREAARRCDEAINRWNEEVETKARKGLL
ncbi:hypothetical protein [Nannocystis sp. SCPEA4]|uniref:hypothetical protein n=1 Tax=Nannocystis sp. SCPEA4 TaxID=2996787 RepID=UPI00227210DE|nr:hypothetical protein [Nannocystis sp. SCPEA4]MCY1055434.1 hypothetical protein [Nannocystis sp. SCPEA4]